MNSVKGFPVDPFLKKGCTLFSLTIPCNDLKMTRLVLLLLLLLLPVQTVFFHSIDCIDFVGSVEGRECSSCLGILMIEL